MQTTQITLKGRGTDADGWVRDEWVVTLYHEGRHLTTKFYTGRLHGKPTRDDVLESLFSDAQGVEWEDAEAWAAELGLNADPAKARAMYERVVEQTARLKEFCGDDYDAMMHEAFAEING